MRPLVAVCLAALALAGCTSIDARIADQGDRLAAICQAAPAVHTAFVILASGADVSSSVIRAEADAYLGLRAICANPPVDTATALMAAADAYAVIASARDEAEAEVQ